MDVIVVGGGVIGFAIARELAARHARVHVIDMRGPGLGATRASAGMLAPHIEGHLDAMLALGCASFASYDSYIERLRADAGRSVEYHHCGTLQVARTADEAERLGGLSSQLTGRGVGHTLLDGPATRAHEPALAPDICAGLLIPDHGYVKVPDLISALVSAAARNGAELISGHVDHIEQSASGYRVRVGDTALDADAVIVAAGSWSRPLMTPPVPVRPVRGQLVQLRFAAPPISRIVWGDGFYLVPWTDGAVLLGATSEEAGFDESSTAAGVEALRTAARDHVPATAAATVEDVRVGLRPATDDELPLIGRSSTMRGVFYATGHYRNGVLLAPLTASLVADMVMDDREGPLLELTRPGRVGL